MSAYEEQVSRVQRWLQRIEDPNVNQIEHLDFLWSFFQNSWHLKDWIENDSALPKATRDSITQAVHHADASGAYKSPFLMICADLANRSKHLDLRHIRNDAKLRGEVRVGITENVLTGESSSSVSWEYVVTLRDGSIHKAVDVAKNAVQQWRSILSSHGLKVP